MSAVKITFVQKDGVEKVVESTALGESLMEIAKANGVTGIYGDCGGGCDCGTCHCYVDAAWQAVVGPPDAVETGTLELNAMNMQPNSRLTCQIKLDPKLDGLKLTVATD